MASQKLELEQSDDLLKARTCAVTPAEARFRVHQASYAVNPVTLEALRLPPPSEGGQRSSGSPGDNYINTLVMAHGKQGMVWTWAQISSTPATPGSLDNLALAMPPRPHSSDMSGSVAQVIGGHADDPTSAIARRLSRRFKRPVFLSLSNVGGSRLSLASSASGMMSLDAVAVSPADEMTALEKCLLLELKALLE
ncbi:hypothetical protein GGI07_001004 [Coemansia sp. Benny D115]|nr:hypothetical protein GGI07_001004 [Coemansia sp. Benny D115]